MSTRPFTLHDIGNFVPGRGIYLSKLRLLDLHGYPTNKEFYVFASTQDLEDKDGNKNFTYRQAAREVGAIVNLHGHAGHYFANYRKFYEALQKGHYEGEWIIPPLELVNGMGSLHGSIVQRHNLFYYRKTGDFGHYPSSFVTEKPDNGNEKEEPTGYGTSSECHGAIDHMWAVRFSTGEKFPAPIAQMHLRFRPCRLEAV